MDFSTGTFDYWPDPGFRGTDHLLLEAIRGTVLSPTFTITFVVG